jgi:hypothetical protein
MSESWNYADLVRSVEVLRAHHGKKYTDALISELVLDATANRIAARALRSAAQELNGSDPSIDPVVEWLFERAKKILRFENEK